MMRDIKLKVEELLDKAKKENEGVFIGLDHKNADFHRYLAEHILADSHIKHLFVEFRRNDIEELIEDYTKNIGKDYLQFPKDQLAFYFLARLATAKENSHMTYVILCAHFIYNIKVIGMDGASDQKFSAMRAEKDKNSLASDEKVMHLRLKQDSQMFQDIRQYPDKGRYLVVAGMAHVRIAKSLNIKSVNVFTESAYAFHQAQLTKVPSLKAMFSSPEMFSDFVFFHDVPTTPTLYLLYNNHGFYSPSRNASQKHCYGPFKDVYCFPEDPAVKRGIEMSLGS